MKLIQRDAILSMVGDRCLGLLENGRNRETDILQSCFVHILHSHSHGVDYSVVIMAKEFLHKASIEFGFKNSAVRRASSRWVVLRELRIDWTADWLCMVRRLQATSSAVTVCEGSDFTSNDDDDDDDDAGRTGTQVCVL